MLALVISGLLIGFRSKEFEEVDALPLFMILGFMEIGFEAVVLMMLIAGGVF